MVALQNLLLTLIASAQTCSGLIATNHQEHCRCRPHESCWPSQDKWDKLNKTINGNLEAVRPVAASCFGESADDTCNSVVANANNSLWRSTHPGAVQWTNWEAWPEKNQTCYLDQAKDVPCQQGRVSLYSAVVESARDIQAAVQFASKYNIRLVVKNSGHCFLGRSTAPESLQISTYMLNNTKFMNRFIPEGAPKCDDAHAAGSAVTIGAGVQLKGLYTEAAKRNVTLVAGMAHTVGAAGGYIQGGGHSPLGTWKGMASDNALEYKVVNAKGELITANDYKNKDLFWALRGGGGGTFGVVVSVTIRTFPDVPGMFAEFGFGAPANNASAYWNLVRDFHAHLPAISDAGGSGYYFVNGRPTNQNGTQSFVLSGGFIFVNQTSKEAVEKVTQPLLRDMKKIGGEAVGMLNVQSMPSMAGWINYALQGESDGGGGIVLTGSRLISRQLMETPDGPSRLADALRTISEGEKARGGMGYTGHLVAGGAVAKNKIDSALLPAWRKTLTHIAFGLDWNSSTPWAEQRAIADRFTNQQVEKLRVLEPDMGAYLNEADANQKDFQKSFWGDNYKRLYGIKQKLDPDNLFIVRKGVGSEDWDDAGLCRVRKRTRTTIMQYQH